MGARTGPRDGVVAALAARQHGVVGRSQLAELGFGRGAIHHRLAAGRLHRLHPAVYAVGHTRLTDRGRWMAAVLACGTGAFLSHQSAGALWGLRPTSRATIDVTAPGRTRPISSGISVHRVRHPHSDDRCVRDGIPVSSAARTLLDLAEVVSPTQLRRAFEEADRLELIDMQSDRATARQKPRPARPQAPGCPTRHPPRPGATDPLRAGTPLPRPLPQDRPPTPERQRPRRRPGSRRAMARAAPHRRARRVRVPPHPRLVRARPHPRRDPPARRLPRPARNPPPARGGARRGRGRGALAARPRGPSPASFMTSINWADRVAVRLGGTAARAGHRRDGASRMPRCGQPANALRKSC